MSAKRTNKERQLSGNETGIRLATSTKLHDRSSKVTKRPGTSDSLLKPNRNIRRTADTQRIHRGQSGNALDCTIMGNN